MKFISTIITLLFFTLCFSQQKFEKGSITFSNGNTIDCLIKFSYSSQNPTSVSYKLSEEAEEKTAQLREVNGFQIDEKIKFIKATVNFDISGNKTGEFSHSRAPEYVEQTTLLEVLIEGTASLYRMEKHTIIRYFYKTGNSEIKPLVYKKYLSNGGLKENLEYIQQLSIDVNCDKNISAFNKNVSYNSSNLTKHFKKYNECEGNAITFLQKKEKAKFKLYAKAGYHFTTNHMNLYGTNKTIKQNSSGNGFEAGLQTELNLPFNYRKWSVVGELTYYGLDHNFTSHDFAISTKNNYIRAATGIRYNFYLNSQHNNKNIIYLEALVTVLNLEAGENSITRTLKYSEEEIDVVDDFKVTDTPNVILGVGFPIYRNLSGSIRYNFPQHYLDTYISNSYKISSFSVNLNYKFL